MSTILEALKKAQKESDERLEAAIVRTEKSGLKRGLVIGLVVLGLALGLWFGYLASVIPPAARLAGVPVSAPPAAGEVSPRLAPPPPHARAAPGPAAVTAPEIAPPGVAGSASPASPAGGKGPGEETAPLLDLSGIIYDPVNPMAIINGRFVGIGDSVGDARVLGIGRESIRISSGGAERTLRLER